jgi:hypothetical protein
MDCHGHPGVPATANCTGCAEPFCSNCLVTIKGSPYCASCKEMALDDLAPPILSECKEANEALKYAIVGIFCCGIVLEPIAISKALKARTMIALDPSLGGRGKATAALVIAVVGLILWVLGTIARMSGAARQPPY